MFIEFVGFPASGKSSAARSLNAEISNIYQNTLLYSHGINISRICHVKSHVSFKANNGNNDIKVIEKINLFFILLTTILTGPVDFINKLRFIKRLLILLIALGKSKDNIVICDEGFVQLYISAQMPARKALNLDALNYDLQRIFQLVSHVIVISCAEDEITARLDERQSDHSRSKKWDAHVTKFCIKEYDRTISLLKCNYVEKVTSLGQEKQFSRREIQDIISELK